MACTDSHPIDRPGSSGRAGRAGAAEYKQRTEHDRRQQPTIGIPRRKHTLRSTKTPTNRRLGIPLPPARTRIRSTTLPHQDLKFSPPALSVTDDSSPLYEQTMSRLTSTRDWYLADKKKKRTFSRWFRGLTTFFTGAGAITPLVPQQFELDLRLGYLLVAIGALIFTFDKYFGTSSAWMRDIASAQRLDAEIAALWRFWEYPRTLEDASKSSRLFRIEAANKLVDDVITTERIAWEREFQSTLSEISATHISARRDHSSGDNSHPERPSE